MTQKHKGSKPPRQESLFDDDAETKTSALVTVVSGAGQLSAAQRTFNRLIQRIERAREALLAWEAFIPRFQTRVAGELQPIEQAVSEAQHKLVRQLHALLDNAKAERLSRKHQSRIRSLLVEVAESLLALGPDPELEALYDRHSDISHAEQRRHELEMTEVLIDGVFGAGATRGHTAQSVEELLRHASENIADAAEKADATFDRPRRGRASAAAERKVQAAREASLSVREIYAQARERAAP